VSLVQQFLESARQVRHLAVTWNIWAKLQYECGALQLESLYLIWDGAFNIFPRFDIREPTLDHLQHPAILENLTVSGPTNLDDPTPWAYWGGMPYLPATRRCVKLTSVIYVTTLLPLGWIRTCDVKNPMVVLVEATEPDKGEQELIKEDKKRNPNYSVVCVQDWNQVLVEWVAKMEGRESILNHPADTAAAHDD
jgi:hypothetical protein